MSEKGELVTARVPSIGQDCQSGGSEIREECFKEDRLKMSCIGRGEIRGTKQSNSMEKVLDVVKGNVMEKER